MFDVVIWKVWLQIDHAEMRETKKVFKSSLKEDKGKLYNAHLLDQN